MWLFLSPWVIPQLFADAVDVIAVRQNMLDIKARAEGAVLPAPAFVYTELALWMAAFLGFLVAEAELVIRRDWLRPLLVVSATGLITIGLLLLKPQLWVDGLATISVLVGLWWIYRPAVLRDLPGTRKRVHGETR